jgi:hypothetical protein
MSHILYPGKDKVRSEAGREGKQSKAKQSKAKQTT